MGKKGKKTSKAAPEYNPTAQERAAMERVFERQATKSPGAKFKIEMTAANVVSISADHPEPSNLATHSWPTLSARATMSSPAGCSLS